MGILGEYTYRLESDVRNVRGTRTGWGTGIILIAIFTMQDKSHSKLTLRSVSVLSSKSSLASAAVKSKS